MKIIPISKNIIGKLIFFENPFLELDKVLENQEAFTAKLENIIDFKLSKLKIEPPDPTKVLAKSQPTINYEYGIPKDFESNKLKKVVLGFGENGYYYDFHLKFEDIDENLEKKEILSTIGIIEKRLEKIETDLEDYYFSTPSKLVKLEISNFVLNLEFSKPLEKILDSGLSESFEEFALHSEKIIPGMRNKINFNFIINFFPEIAEDGLITNSKEIIVPDRMIIFSRDLTKPKKFIYYVRMRGLPVIQCISFLEKIETSLNLG